MAAHVSTALRELYLGRYEGIRGPNIGRMTEIKVIKQLLISFGGGLLLLCIWAAIVVATSQDFVHEGPHGVWATPVEAWGRVLVDIGWSRWLLSVSPIPRFILGVTMLLGPFVLALSAIVHLTIWSLRRMVSARKT